MIAIGVGAFFATTICIVGSLSVLPNYLNAIFGLMVFILLALAYFFGHVALNISLGKTLQRYLLKESHHSETLSILLGVVGWTVLLSVPYVWTIALFVLFSASIGLVLTGRPTRTWQTP